MKANTYEVNFKYFKSHVDMSTAINHCMGNYKTLDEAMQCFKKYADKAPALHYEDNSTYFELHIWYWDCECELHSVFLATSQNGLTWAF